MEDKQKNLVDRIKGAGMYLLKAIRSIYTPTSSQPYSKPEEPKQQTFSDQDTPRLPWNIYDLREFYRKRDESYHKPEQLQK